MFSESDLRSKKLQELKEIANALKIKGASTLRKGDLVELIMGAKDETAQNDSPSKESAKSESSPKDQSNESNNSDSPKRVLRRRAPKDSDENHKDSSEKESHPR